MKRKLNKHIHELSCIELNQLVKNIQLLRSEGMRMEKARYLLPQFLSFSKHCKRFSNLIWLTLVIFFVVNRNWIVHRRRMINWTVNGNRVIICTMFVIFLQFVFVSDQIVDLTNGSLTALSFQWISQRNGHQDHQKSNKNLGARIKIPNLWTKYVTESRSYYSNSDLPLASFCRKSSLRYEILDNIGMNSDLFNRPYIWKDFPPNVTIYIRSRVFRSSRW